MDSGWIPNMFETKKNQSDSTMYSSAESRLLWAVYGFPKSKIIFFVCIFARHFAVLLAFFVCCVFVLFCFIFLLFWLFFPFWLLFVLFCLIFLLFCFIPLFLLSFFLHFCLIFFLFWLIFPFAHFLCCFSLFFLVFCSSFSWCFWFNPQRPLWGGVNCFWF